MWILVDTNVFLDCLVDKEGKSEATKFFLNCKRKKCSIFITSMSLRDIEYAAHRITHDKALSKRILLAAYEMCTKVIGINADDAITSIYSDVDDYEDSLAIEAAKREMINIIVTNNIKVFSKSNFPCCTPKAFNEAIESAETN